MKNLFQHLFGIKHKQTKNFSEARPLHLEHLEDRRLLSVSWAGFSPLIPDSYQIPSTNAFNFVSTPEMLQIADVNNDGKNDIIAVDFADVLGTKDTITVYLNGSETEPVKTVFENSGFGNSDSGIAMTFIDFDGRGGVDDLIVIKRPEIISKGEIKLSWQVYLKDQITYEYTKGSSGNITLLSSDTEKAVTGVTARWAPNSKALIVQSDIIDISFQNGSKILSKFSFDSENNNLTGTNITTSYSSDLLNVVSFYNGSNYTDYVVGVGDESDAYKLTFHDVSNGSPNTTWNFSDTNLASFEVHFLSEASVSENKTLIYFGGVQNSTSYITIAELSVNSSNRIVVGTSLKTEISDFTISNSTAAAVGDLDGDLDGDDLPDLVLSGSKVVILTGVNGGSTSSLPVDSFEPLTIVPSPQILSSTIVDLVGKDGSANSDGVNDLLLVGTNSAWIYYKDSADKAQWKEIPLNTGNNSPFTKAVFADIDGDKKLDIVITDSIGAYVFIQSEDLQFCPNYTLSGWVYNDNGLTSQSTVIHDIAVGNFFPVQEKTIAILFTAADQKQYINIYDESQTNNIQTIKLNDFDSRTLTTLTAGKLYGSDYDDLIIGPYREGSKASILIAKNTGGSFNITKQQIISSGASSGDSISFQIDDIDRDGTNELLYLYSSSGSNNSKLGYLKRNGEQFTDTLISSGIESGSVLSGLWFGYVNQDAYKDIVCTATSSSGTKILTWLGTENSYSRVLVDPETNINLETQTLQSGLTAFESSVVSAGRYIDGNYSNDIVIAWGDKIYMWRNSAASSGASGEITVLCQSLNLDLDPGISFNDAKNAARTWIDEWSNFYLDLWGKNNGGGAIESFTIKIHYNRQYFVVVEEDVSDPSSIYTITKVIDADTGTITVSGTLGNGQTAVGNSENALLARVRFKPADGAGVSLTDFTTLEAVSDNGFHINSDECLINDLGLINGQNNVEKADAKINSESLKLYPVIYDLKEDGIIGVSDFGIFIGAFGKRVENTDDKLADFNGDGIIGVTDFGLFTKVFGSAKNSTSDSLYDPVWMDKRLNNTGASELPSLMENGDTINEEIVPESEPLDADLILAESILPEIDYTDYIILLLEEDSKKDQILFGEEGENYDPIDDMVSEFLTRTVDRRALGV